jgi:hypothetical protein
MKQILAPKGKNGYPPEIAQNIVIGDAKQEGDGKYSITVSIDLSEGAAPMARAFEFGSGLHAELGKKGTYEIKPKKSGGHLSFEKSKWPKYDPNYFEEGKPGVAPDWFHFTFVNHPGIVARPFMRPSVVATKPEIINILGNSFKASILINLKEVWST